MPATQTFALPAGYRHRGHLTPWWVGCLLVNPLRRLVTRPDRVLGPYVKPAQTVLEVGPGMGFFSLTLARLVGDGGRVIGVDCQPRMLERLRRRAAGRGLAGRFQLRECRRGSLTVGDLREAVDTVVAIDVVREADDPERMVGEMVRTLRPGGRLLLSEPRGLVSRDLFLWEYGLCREAGLVAVDWPRHTRRMTVVMEKPDPGA